MIIPAAASARMNSSCENGKSKLVPGPASVQSQYSTPASPPPPSETMNSNDFQPDVATSSDTIGEPPLSPPSTPVHALSLINSWPSIARYVKSSTPSLN